MTVTRTTQIALIQQTCVENPLRNLERAIEEIRAAAAILIMLGRTYIWPINDLDRHCSLLFLGCSNFVASTSN